ncbi:MAG: adenylate/guanylate cyclase domain-containing protein [Deltaproteobacteria bacterium]|nr:adenylate/guanylate cyclase domain-containing protein [Deltaproteobacteria bacterium]
MTEPALKTWSGEFADVTTEAAFAREHFERTVRLHTRYALAVSTITMLSYGIHDVLVIPSQSALVLALRYGIFCPIALAVTVITFRPLHARLYPWVSLAYGLACSASVLAVASVVPQQLFLLYTSYAALFLTLGPFIGMLNVRAQTVFSLATLVFYGALNGHHIAAQPALGIALGGTLFAMGTIGTLLARQQAQQARREYLQRQEIHAQSIAIAEARARAEALLLNILPARVATRLKAQERPIADAHAQVSVLFADVVGFTAMSDRMAAADVVQRLDVLFSACDALVEALGLEKIKTIGDAYMAVGGLDERSLKDHADLMLSLGLGMLREVEKFNAQTGEKLALRVGIHSGPVVAGVIGTSKFAYDVWGDTVNTASRMESHGVAGTVQISERTRALLSESHAIEDRGEIEVKGKGTMHVWLARPEAQSSL